MHVGHDTHFYLAKGFDVVAVEANPDLVRKAETRFATEIANGRLRIFGVAIAERRGEITFAIGDASELSTAVMAETQRAEQHGARFRHITVPAVPFDDILREVGVPYYLKVDIQGMDLMCAKALRAFEDRPPFLSIESTITSAEPVLGLDKIFDELAELWTLGYRRFQYVNQMRPQRLPIRPLEGDAVVQPELGAYASGAFGLELPGRWLRVEQALLRGWALRVQQEVGGHRGRWASLPPGILYRGVRSRI